MEANQQLRALRLARTSRLSPGEPLSRSELAELVNAQVEETTGRVGALDANYIGKLERGVITWPRAHYRAALREILGTATDRDLGFAPPTSRRDPEVLGVLTTMISSELHGEGSSSAWRQMLPALCLPTDRVGRDHVVGLRAAAHMFATVDHGHGGVDVRSVASIHLQHAGSLLSLPCPTSVRGELFSAVGWLAHVVGFAAFDSTDHTRAGRILRFALSCAEQAVDWHLRAKILSTLGREAIWRGNVDAGLTWIELALVRADRLTATERAMLLTGRARALALLGRVEDTWRCVRAADEQFCRIRRDDDPPWMHYYDLPQHLGDTGHALFDLATRHGQYIPEATRRLRTAVQTHQELYARSRTMSGLKLAALTLHTGEVDQAAAYGTRAMNDLRTIRSARADQVAQQLYAATTIHLREPSIAELRHDLDAHLTSINRTVSR
jgi:hypothetical protein